MFDELGGAKLEEEEKGGDIVFELETKMKRAGGGSEAPFVLSADEGAVGEGGVTSEEASVDTYDIDAEGWYSVGV